MCRNSFNTKFLKTQILFFVNLFVYKLNSYDICLTVVELQCLKILEKNEPKGTEADGLMKEKHTQEANQQSKRCKGAQRQEVTQSMTKDGFNKIKQEMTELNANHDTLEVLVG